MVKRKKRRFADAIVIARTERRNSSYIRVRMPVTKKYLKVK